MQEALGKVAQKVDVVMRKYVSDNGYTLLLNAGDQPSPVMWAAAEPNADITMAVIEAYNAASKVAPPPPAAPAAAARPKPASTTTAADQPCRKARSEITHSRELSQKGGLRASLLYCCTRNSATPRIADSLWIKCGFRAREIHNPSNMTAASADASTVAGIQVAWFHVLEVRFRQLREVAASALQIPQRNGVPQRQEGPGGSKPRDGMNQEYAASTIPSGAKAPWTLRHVRRD